MLHSLLILVIVLSLLVFVHEFGHFITAKLCKAKVEEFGFGFPPRLFGVKRGGTIYSINLIPLGGFVRIKGEAGDNRDRDSFAAKPLGQRALILSAGVLMNLFLAWVLLSVGYAVGLPQVLDDLPPSAAVRDVKTRVYSVIKDSPAASAGLEAGDTLISLDGVPAGEVGDIRAYTAERAGTAIVLVIDRESRDMEISVTPAELSETGRVGMGAALIQTGLVSYPVWMAPIQGLAATGAYVREIGYAFYDLFRGLFVERRVAVELSGPVGIAVLTAEVARAGFIYLLQFTAVLSVNLALINILPFPALDGGRLAFLAVERIRRRPVSARLESLVHNLGFAALMLLVLVITYRDVIKFGDRIRDSFSRLIGG